MLCCVWFEAHCKSVNSVKFLQGSKLPPRQQQQQLMLVTGSDDASVAVWTLQQMPDAATVRMK